MSSSAESYYNNVDGSKINVLSYFSHYKTTCKDLLSKIETLK